jgi:hypothetical protein
MNVPKFIIEENKNRCNNGRAVEVVFKEIRKENCTRQILGKKYPAEEYQNECKVNERYYGKKYFGVQGFHVY